MAGAQEMPESLTWDEAGRLVAYHQGLTGSGDVKQVMKAFVPDVMVRYADFPEIRGQAELKRFMAARFFRQRNYRLQKQLRAVFGNMLVCSWDGTWEDGRDGRAMEGRGVEFMTIDQGLVVIWEAVFNVWERGLSGSLPIV